jgi:membrane protease subunit HflK
MAWDDGDKDKGNPWRSDKDKGPADLDAVVRDFQRKLASLFGGGRGGSGGRSGGEQPLSAGLLGAGALLLVGVWALTGLYKVDAAERGLVLRFGAYQGLTQPGLRWHLPWPIEQVEKINIGATESMAYRGSMLTRDDNIINVELVVQLRRTDPQSFLFNMRDPEDTLTDVTASAIREVVGRNVLDFILTDGRTEVARETQDLLQATLDAYGAGVTIYEVNMQEANFPREVEGSVQEAIKAREDRERRILEAQSYSNDILPRARGEAERRRQNGEAYRAQVVADAEGESDRFTSILGEYLKAPAVTRERIYLETLEEILATSTKVLVDTDGGNNVLYLPLDQLTRQRPLAPGNAQPQGGVTSVPMTSNIAPRSREREGR